MTECRCSFPIYIRQGQVRTNTLHPSLAAAPGHPAARFSMPVARHFLFLLVQAVHARAGDEARMCLRVCSLGCAHSGERTARQSSPRATFLQAFSFRRANAARSENDSFSEPIDDRQVFSFVSSAQSAASQESQIVAIVLNVLVALALQKRHHRSLF
jgi:hypothetical protein